MEVTVMPDDIYATAVALILVAAISIIFWGFFL